ncbi:MAG TPA: HAMP domain-containing protein, partial [Planctomycetota bacterium]|nr:HAMP domain-containing protein [Planctomycetota bacterium]
MKYVAKVSLVTVLASLLGMAALFLIQFHYASIYEEHDRIFSGYLRQLDAARLIQVHFKKQVQEWKDILLRGHEEKDLEDHTQAFLAQESRVRTEVARLETLLEDPGARSILAEFAASHQKLGDSYRQALELFKGSRDPRQADRLVRGQDRIPTDRIDSIVGLLTADSDRWEAASRASLSSEQARIRLLSMAFFVGILGVAFYFTLRFTSPIVRLSRMVRSIAEHQNYGVRAEVSGNDEVSDLMGGINGMLGEVQAGQAQLRKSRDLLEHRVTELADREEQLRSLTDSVS